MIKKGDNFQARGWSSSSSFFVATSCWLDGASVGSLAMKNGIFYTPPSCWALKIERKPQQGSICLLVHDNKSFRKMRDKGNKCGWLQTLPFLHFKRDKKGLLRFLRLILWYKCNFLLHQSVRKKWWQKIQRRRVTKRMLTPLVPTYPLCFSTL